MSDRSQQLPLRVEACVSMHRLLLALGSQDLAIRCQADGEHIVTPWPANIEPQTNEIRKASWLEQQGVSRVGPNGLRYHEVNLAGLSISEREVLVIARELLKCAAFTHQRDATALRNRQRADSLCRTIDGWLERDFPTTEAVKEDRTVLAGDTDGNVFTVDREAFYADGPWHLGVPVAPLTSQSRPSHRALHGFEYPTKAAAFAAAEERRAAGAAEAVERVYPGPIGDTVQIVPRSWTAHPNRQLVPPAQSGARS